MAIENYFESSPGLLETSGIDQVNSVSVIDALDGLSVEKPFGFFDLAMSREGGDFLQNISVERASEMRLGVNSGNINEHDVAIALEGFINNISEQNKEVSARATSIIQKEISSILGSGGDALVLMRSELSSPRHQWHVDSSVSAATKIFSEECKEDESLYGFGLDCKELEIFDILDKPYGEVISISLKGESTIFSDVPSFYRGAFSNGLLEGIQLPVSDGTLNQGAVFIGHSDYGAVHSNPIFHTPRLVMLVILGDEKTVEAFNLFQSLEDARDEAMLREELATNIDYDKLCQYFNYCTTPSNIRQ